VGDVAIASSATEPALSGSKPVSRAAIPPRRGSRRPFFLITVSSRSWTRSKVVNRALQFAQAGRRRITPPSSLGRESLTWLSSVPQNGHRIPCLSCTNGQQPAHSEHRKPCAAWPPDGRNTDITTPFAAVPRRTVPPCRRRDMRVRVRNLRETAKGAVRMFWEMPHYPVTA
jgi:hypothetical protein